jgi:protein-disulfide isomerase
VEAPQVQKAQTKKFFSNFLFFSTGLLGATLIASCTQSVSATKPNIVVKEATKPGIVAKIGNVEITEEQLIGDDKLDFFELKKREYDLKMDRLNQVILETLIGGEAKSANMPLEEYISKKVVKEVKLTEKDITAFIKDKKIPESQVNPEIKERIKAYLQNEKKQEQIQAYIAKLTKSSPVEAYFAKPKMVMNVEIGSAPVWGKADAPVTLIEYSDFQCPYCSKGASVVTELKKKYGEKKLKVAFKHFPLPMHKDAKPASEASMCVHEQSADKFWKFHDLAFAKQDKLDAASLEGYAKESGADLAKFKECMSAGKFRKLVEDDLEKGGKLGIRSTPTFFVNGQLISGALPASEFSKYIDEELAAKK